MAGRWCCICGRAGVVAPTRRCVHTRHGLLSLPVCNDCLGLYSEGWPREFIAVEGRSADLFASSEAPFLGAGQAEGA